MSTPEAQRFLEQLRAATEATLGPLRLPSDPAFWKKRVDEVIRENPPPEEHMIPALRAKVEQYFARARKNPEAAVSEVLAERMDEIERIAASQVKIDDVAFTPARPAVGLLRTGQLNAASMRVPGTSDAYLVLFEDQMISFTQRLGRAIAWAIDQGPNDANGRYMFDWSESSTAKRLKAHPEVAEHFTSLVVDYAVTGMVGALDVETAPARAQLASRLSNALQYFVLGHEYAHIMLRHVDVSPTRKAVLPAAEAEVLMHSWRDEIQADQTGLALALSAGSVYGAHPFPQTVMGACLFFEALEVMDRAVALLQTGDEDSRQLGSHPPAVARKAALRSMIKQMPDSSRRNVEVKQTALDVTEILEGIISLLWGRTRPILLEMRRRGVQAAHTWRTIPKETGDPGGRLR
ncbi:hypothetical protein ACQP1W_28675 [Spirillospora sp. CA-255316]